MGDLYEEMKASLKFFDLAFSKMHEVEMRSLDSKVEFSHGGRTIIIDTTGPQCP